MGITQDVMQKMELIEKSGRRISTRRASNLLPVTTSLLPVSSVPPNKSTSKKNTQKELSTPEKSGKEEGNNIGESVITDLNSNLKMNLTNEDHTENREDVLPSLDIASSKKNTQHSPQEFQVKKEFRDAVKKGYAASASIAKSDQAKKNEKVE